VTHLGGSEDGGWTPGAGEGGLGDESLGVGAGLRAMGRRKAGLVHVCAGSSQHTQPQLGDPPWRQRRWRLDAGHWRWRAGRRKVGRRRRAAGHWEAKAGLVRMHAAQQGSEALEHAAGLMALAELCGIMLGARGACAPWQR
jgi:hypothetical protein